MKKNYTLLLLSLFILNMSNAQEKKEEKEQKQEKANKNLPIKPQRFYKLSTDTGSWMSLDVSPDGAIMLNVLEYVDRH